MPGFVAHALVPLLPLLAFTRFPRRLVWATWPLTFAPDLDYFFGIHRATLTNVWVVLVPALLALAAPRHPRLSPWRDVFLLSAIFLGAHLLMDLFVGGIVPFWPFVDWTWVVDLTVDVDTARNRPLVYFDYGTFPGAPTVSRVYAFLTRTDVALLLGVLAVAAGTWLSRAIRRRRGIDAPGDAAKR